MAANGGFLSYPDKINTAIFFRASKRATKTVTIKSGQVIKGLSFLETDVNGKAIAHGGLVESATATFGTGITTGQTIILAGLTFTAGSGSVTATQLADIWSDLPAGTTAAQANTIILAKGYSASTVGSFTSGTLTGYATSDVSTTKIRFDAVGTGAASATDVAVTGTGAAAVTIAITQFAALNKVAGILVYDVDASASDVDASAYINGSFWADALVWAVDTSVDTIVKPDNTTIAVTAYNTGCAGISDTSNLLKKKFVEGTNFEELGFTKVGEVY